MWCTALSTRGRRALYLLRSAADNAVISQAISRPASVGDPASFRLAHLRNATAVQTASTMPNGHVPARNPYTDDAPHAAENRRTNARDRSSSAYATSIVDTATNPNKVRMLTGSV